MAFIRLYKEDDMLDFWLRKGAHPICKGDVTVCRGCQTCQTYPKAEISLGEERHLEETSDAVPFICVAKRREWQF